MRCDVAYSCGSIIAALHAVINDSRRRRAAAQSGAEGAPERAESLGGKSRPVGMKTQKLEGRREEAPPAHGCTQTSNNKYEQMLT